MSLSWTIGEPVIETFRNENITLTQGFQQPYNFYLTQILNIPQGWSGVSGYIDPLNKGLESMFDEHIPDFILLSSLTGFYYPGAGTNTIGQWHYGDGYKIKAQDEFTVSLSGNMVNPTVQLSEGWNLIPVLSKCGASTSDIFGGMANLIIAKEVAGVNVYWPQYGINTLTTLETGKAYLVRMASENTFTYPECTKSTTTIPMVDQPMPVAPWNEVKQTGVSHVVALPADVLLQLNAQPGDVVGLFTMDGLCVGNQTITNPATNQTVVAFADDAITPQKEGFDQGQQMIVKMYRPSTDRLMELQVEFDPMLPNMGYYAPEGLSVVKSATIQSTAQNVFPERAISIYPNPSHGQFTVSMTQWPENLQLHLFDTKGNFMNQIQPGVLEAGANYQLNLSALPPGVYHLKFVTHSFVEIQKIIIQ
jgi:antitoxin component of MazEF toxin-antitoxin module